MENLDFDDTVVFAWEWAERLNAHLKTHAYHEKDEYEPKHKCGLSTHTLEEISLFILTDIVEHPHPTALTNAYRVHLKEVLGYTQRPFMPSHYTNCQHVTRHVSMNTTSVGPAHSWDTQAFFKGLQNNVHSMAQRYVSVHAQANTLLNPKSKHKI